MKPTNKTNLSRCPEGISTSNCVTWTGPNIPCIELCNGDSVSDIVFKVGEKLCEIYDDYSDLENLDFQCVVDELSVSCPKDTSLKAMFQLLLDNDCKLKDLIDAITVSAQEANGIVLTALDLKCLQKEFISCDDCSEEDIVSVLQKIIDKICEHETRITKNEEDIQDIDVRLQTVEDRTDPTGPIVEAEINTCLNLSPATPATVSNHIETFTDPAICAMREILGKDNDLLAAFSKRCPNFFTTTTPTTVAGIISEMWEIICSIRETQLDCCKTTCDKIKVGYGTSYNAGSSVLTLSFSGTFGNDIPNDLTDCGSTVTVTDINNNTASNAFQLSDVGTVDINLSALDTTDNLTIAVKYCLSNDEITCSDCVVTNIDKLTDSTDCEICRYSVSGIEGSFVIVNYTTTAGTVSAKLTPGELLQFKMPDNQAVINSISPVNGAIFNDETNCSSIPLPTQTPNTCWFFEYPRTNYITSFGGFTLGNPEGNVTIWNFGNITTTQGVSALGGNSPHSALAPGGANPQSSVAPINYPTSLPDEILTSTLCQDPSNSVITTKWGIILDIAGQDPTVPPMMSFIQNYTEDGQTDTTEFFIKGELITNCQCP